MADLEFRLATKDEITDADYLACHPVTVPLILPDNRTGTCCACGVPVQFRPIAAMPAKLCIQCAIQMLKSRE